MRLLLFFFILFFLPIQEKNSSYQKLIGDWNICMDSLIDNPPTFLTCKYKIDFEETGYFNFSNNGDNQKIIGRGTFTLIYDSEINDNAIYQLSLTLEEEPELILKQYIPLKSLIFISDDAILFLTDDTNDLSTPFFLKKNEL